MVAFLSGTINKTLVALILTMMMFLPLNAWWKEQMYNFEMGRIPKELGATEIAYSSEEGAGMGPGANEAGVVVYPMPETVVLQIEREGISFFKSLSSEWRGWSPTPVATDDDRWASSESITFDPSGTPLSNYLDKYGFSIQVDATVRRNLDEAIQNPGNFYTYGRAGGVIIVVPSLRKTFLIYAG